MNAPNSLDEPSFTLHQSHRNSAYLDKATPNLTFDAALIKARELSWEHNWKITRDSDGTVLVQRDSDLLNTYLWASVRREQLKARHET